MKTESDLDELFKGKLYEYESVPSKDSWEELSNKLDNLEKEGIVKSFSFKKFVLPMAAVLLLLIGISVVFWNSDNEKSEVAIVQKSIKSEASVSPISVNPPPKITSGYDDETLTSSHKEPKVSEPDIELKLLSHQTSDKIEEVLLPDSSIISINKNSKVSYAEDFTKNRVVYLDGEAFFNVRHKNGIPFIVYGNQSKTEVLGTSFLIRSDKKTRKDEIIVKTGKVDFSSINVAEKHVLLKAGMKGITDSPGNTSSDINTDMNFDSWKTKKLVFSGAQMEEVIKAIEKHYQLKIKTEDPEILKCKYTGVFEGTSIDNVIKVLSISFNITTSTEENTYVITGKKNK